MKNALFLLCFICACSTYASHAAHAQDNNETLESVHTGGKAALFELTDDIDEFFGDIRTDEKKREDWFRLGTEVRFRATDPVRIRERLRAGLNLSDYAKNLRIFVNGTTGDQIENGRLEQDLSDGQDFVTDYRGDAASTGISYDFVKTETMLISSDLGLKFGGGAHPFGDVRASKWFDLGNNFSFEPTQFFQWIHDDGFGEKTRADFNFKSSPKGRIRSRTEGLWSESSRGVDLLEDLTYVYKMTDRRYAGIGLSLTAYTDPSWTPDVYKASLRYREAVYKDWLFLETEPALEYPEERDYKTTPSITFRLDMYFER